MISSQRVLCAQGLGVTPSPHCHGNRGSPGKQLSGGPGGSVQRGAPGRNSGLRGEQGQLETRAQSPARLSHTEASAARGKGKGVLCWCGWEHRRPPELVQWSTAQEWAGLRALTRLVPGAGWNQDRNADLLSAARGCSPAGRACGPIRGIRTRGREPQQSLGPHAAGVPGRAGPDHPA